MSVRAAGSTADDEGERAFLAENGSAMTAMMRRMEITPSGNIDRDFVAMMAPHHQGAIDMAQAYLRFGHNEQLRRLAQEIIVEQQQEILAMRLAVGLPLPPPVAPTDIGGPSGIPVPVEEAHREGGERVLPLHGHHPEQLQESR
ncbi:DUF305 domain-containing protein [Cupriavidus sp. CV2]|uniref:DUF305 domain-containing protein n=1 Tax=Cupriavidus ulmosensis TaxID=3065913 RepID=UPI00296AA37F|nr:DUF305 domain-containing protein [Cupriavidus sp. CV2]MDW3684731.1 DUF305 domain-containing protein [Cupriavidus sp. CV2]